MQDGFAESTIEATVWLIAHGPAERLEDWLDRHEPGLKTIALDRIEKAKQLCQQKQSSP